MPFPSASSFTQTKWLAFFAELTAKLTHHNVLVVMEGAELLKRLLISRVSIAAVLQQGELLERLLDCWRGCVRAEHARTISRTEHAENSRNYNSSAATAPSAAVALNNELSFVLAESISQCIDLMWSLYADGDTYYCLLVLARAGPMLEVLVDVLRTSPPQLYGITASLLQQLLSLPLGHSEVAIIEHDDGEQFTGLDKNTLAQVYKSVALRRHLRTLVEAVQEHGALLQHTADVLAGLLAVQQGPRCLAAVNLFNLASKRLRKYELRHGQTEATGKSPRPSVSRCNADFSSDMRDCTVDNSELNVTITGAPQARVFPLRSPHAKSKSAPSYQQVTSALDDLEEGVESFSSVGRPSASTQRTHNIAQSAAGVSKLDIKTDSPMFPEDGEQKNDSCNSSPTGAIDKGGEKQSSQGIAPQDVSAQVDEEPMRYACTVPPSLAEEALRHLTAAGSHEAFFDALDWLWCLTVADAAAVGAALSSEVLTQGLGRYLRATPRTRRDRVLFTLLLLWLGHMHSINALRGDTHRCLLDVAALSLLPMLQVELTKDGVGDNSRNDEQKRVAAAAAAAAPCATSNTASLNVSAITPTDNSATGVTSAMVLAASTGYSLPCTDRNSFSNISAGGAGLPFMSGTATPQSRNVPWANGAEGGATALFDTSLLNAGDATLLPYAAARKAQEAALLLRPSIEVILLSFLLNIHAGIDTVSWQAWVCRGRVLNVAFAAVRRASGVSSALLDTPGTVDGALSDEVYLDYALRSVRTDVTTVAVLGCRLIAAVLGSELRWGPRWRDAHQRREVNIQDPACKCRANDNVRGDVDDAAMQAELVFFTQAMMPLLVHIAVHNPDVTSAQEGGAASPVHYVPANLRCTRYTSLGESSLVALDACLQYYAQSGHLRSRSGAASDSDSSRVSTEDLVRVLPALTRVSHSSVHPPIRAIPYRCLLYIGQRIEDVLVVLRDMPSLANAAVACVLDYGATSSQWEVAAAAEWLTVLVDFMTEAETATAAEAKKNRKSSAKERPPPEVDATVAGTDNDVADTEKRGRRSFFFLSPAEQLQEYFHFDDSPLSRKLLTNVVAARRSNTGSSYAMSALLQLAVHLQTYIDNRRQIRDAQSSEHAQLNSPQGQAEAHTDEPITPPLTPNGLSSITQWIQLLQNATADNTRLTRICAAFHRGRDRLRTRVRDELTSEGHAPESTLNQHTRRQETSKPVLKDAWTRALTAAEQIALQYTFTATLFRALDTLFCQDHLSVTPYLYGNQFSNSLVCNAVVAAIKLPSPHDVASLLSMRFHAANTSCETDSTAEAAATSPISPPMSSTALLFGYQAVIQWACRLGASWLRSAYPCCWVARSDETAKTNAAASVACGGGLPHPCSAALVEDVCAATTSIMRNDAAALSHRTRCHAAALLSALVESCPTTQLPLLEAFGAALFAASVTLRRTICVSGLQCRLVRRVWSAARYACAGVEHNWLNNNVEALRSTVARIKEIAGDSPSDNAPRRTRSVHRRQLARSPNSPDAASMARNLQACQILVSLLASVVACTGATSDNNASSSSAPSETPLLITPPQRQTLCAALCDALGMAPLRYCVLTALRSISATAEGRRCLLTDISTAGDPLGRTLFGRVLALTLHIPCRWARTKKGMMSSLPSAVASHVSTPNQCRRSPSASPRPLSPAATSPHSPHAVGNDGSDNRSASGGIDIDGDAATAVAGCDLCTSLIGWECAEGKRTGETPGENANAASKTGDPAEITVTPHQAPAFSFLAAFLKLRGLEYLTKNIVEIDRQRRRQGRPLTVPPHLLRLLAALSLDSTVAKDIVKSADLFSIVLEVAGAAFASHAMTATLALLTLRNVCFAEGLKSTFCQDARVLLTLKAAALRLTCVSQLVEDSARPTSRTSVKKQTILVTSPNAGQGSTSAGGRRTCVEVTLRDDVVDPENAVAVSWATQMCLYARAQHTVTVQTSNKQAARNALETPSRCSFHDITNSTSRHSIFENSALSTELNGGVDEAAQRRGTATDVEAGRRQYLAATALASLWFDNQRGKAALAEVLGAAPSCDIVELQEVARATPKRM